MDELTIRIYPSSDEVGFFYDIYEKSDICTWDEPENVDGGFCTSENIEDALEMACEQAKVFIKNNNKVTK